MGDGRSAAAGILADGQAADESAAGGSARNQRMFVEGLRGERQHGGQLLAQGTSGSEHDRAGDTVAGSPGKGAAIDKAAQATTASGARSDRGEGAAAAEAEAMAVG